MNTTQADQMEIDIDTVSSAIMPNLMLVIGNKARRDAERNVSQAWVRIICLLRLAIPAPSPVAPAREALLSQSTRDGTLRISPVPTFVASPVAPEATKATQGETEAKE